MSDHCGRKEAGTEVVSGRMLGAADAGWWRLVGRCNVRCGRSSRSVKVAACMLRSCEVDVEEVVKQMLDGCWKMYDVGWDVNDGGCSRRKALRKEVGRNGMVGGYVCR